MPLIYYLNTRKGRCTGISFIDGMGIPICHNRRAERNKVFEKLAAWGKSSVDWYFGFKLHLIINDQGELLAFQVTPGNIDERKPVFTLPKNLWGKMFGVKPMELSTLQPSLSCWRTWCNMLYRSVISQR